MDYLCKDEQTRPIRLGDGLSVGLVVQDKLGAVKLNLSRANVRIMAPQKNNIFLGLNVPNLKHASAHFVFLVNFEGVDASCL